MRPIGLYIHIPFCENKCPYCDFYSLKAEIDIMNRYTNMVCETLLNYAKNMELSFDTVYFGGGTPSLLGNKNLSKIMNTIRDNFNLCASEVTLEINPTSSAKLDFIRLKDSGINRLSIGVQSAFYEELKELGRKHSVQDAELTIKMAQQTGFNNISLDLMIAVPGQTKSSLKQSIDFCVAQKVQHISAYLLKIEKNTPFYKMQDQLNLKDDDEQAELYLYLVDELDKRGFKQYETSNFAKKSYEGQHNLKYWNAEEYLGIGPSAHSFINGQRFFYPRSLADFLSGKIKVVEDGIGGTPEEYAMLRLRLREGLNNKAFKKRFGIDIPRVYFEKASLYQKNGLTYVDENNISFTSKGFLLSNALTSQIIL